MRQLSEILLEKLNHEVKSKAALGRLLGVSGPAILQYIQGRMPSFDIAIKWKQAFDENLIDLIFEEPHMNMVAEPQEKYMSLKEELDECRKDLINCMKAKDRLNEENDRLKKFRDAGEELKK